MANPMTNSNHAGLVERLKAAAVTAADAPTGVDVVLLADALRIAALQSAGEPVAPGVIWMDVDPSQLPCGRCGGEVREFAIPNEVWNLVMRPHGKEGELPEYICLGCWHERLLAALQSRQVEVPVAFTKKFQCSKCETGFQLTIASTPCPACDAEACALQLHEQSKGGKV